MCRSAAFSLKATLDLDWDDPATAGRPWPSAGRGAGAADWCRGLLSEVIGQVLLAGLALELEEHLAAGGEAGTTGGTGTGPRRSRPRPGR